MPHDARVFISYLHSNKRTVRRLVADLKAAGVDVWWDEDGLKGGAKWKRQIREAINSGAFFIACFSKQYERRNRRDGEGTYMNEELLVAIERLRKLPQARQWFIPVCLSPCEVPDYDIGQGQTLRDLHYLKLGRAWDNGLSRILEVIAPEEPLPPRLRAELIRAQDPDAQVREDAVRALGSMSSVHIVEPLLAALRDDSPRVRWAAAEAFCKRKESRAIEPLITSLRDSDAGVRRLAAYALAAIADRRAVPALVKALQDREAPARGAAAAALGAIGDRSAVDALLVSLADGSEHVRWKSAEALGLIGDARAIEGLAKRLSDDSASVRSTSAQALARIGGDGVTFLIRALGEGDEQLRVVAASALGESADLRSLEPLISALDDSSLAVRQSAASSLWKLGHKRGVHPADEARGNGRLQ